MSLSEMSHEIASKGAPLKPKRPTKRKGLITGVSRKCPRKHIKNLLLELGGSRPVESLLYLRRIGEVWVTYVNERDAIYVTELLDNTVCPPGIRPEDQEPLGQFGDLMEWGTLCAQPTQRKGFCF